MKSGWRTQRIGDVCQLMTGGTPSRANRDYFGGDIKWLVSGDVHQGEIFDCAGRITELGMRNSNARLLPVNSVLIALNGQGKTRGTVALLRTKATCNQSLVSIYPTDPEAVLPEYLYANLRSRYDEIRRMTGDSGNDRRGLNMPLIRAIQIPIAPPTEQRRIVGILDEAFAAIATAKANTEKNLQNTRAILQTQLELVFTRPGSAWTERRLEQLGVTQTGSTPKTSEKANYGDFIPFIKPADFNKNGSLNYDNEGLSQRGLDHARKVAPGSVLMVCIGATIGKCGYSDRHVTTNQQINSLTPSSAASYKFLYYQMLTLDFQRRVRLNASQATLPIISKSKWAALTVTLPGIEQQNRIVAQFDALTAEIERTTANFTQKLTALDDLRKSILQQAFAGAL